MWNKGFIRKVGFGLRPNEKIPKNPLNWAKAQMNTTPKLIWPGKIYSEKEEFLLVLSNLLKMLLEQKLII